MSEVHVDVANATDEEAAAIAAALTLLLARPAAASAPPAAEPERWRFSGRWWAKPIPSGEIGPGWAAEQPDGHSSSGDAPGGAGPGGRPGPLADVVVLDLATVIAGPSCAKYFADFGADVIKVERPPDGDTTRRMAFTDPADGVSLAWKLFNRGKRTIALDLREPSDLALLLDLVEGADVLVENFRPGKLEALGLAPDVLWDRNPRLVVTRVSGFGQDGPYAAKAGFATLAEAMSGWASISGEPDRGPLLPPIALTDEIAGLVAAFATMVALHAGVGQVVDVNLLESLFQIMGPLPSAWQRAGFVQGRMGSELPHSVPRGCWQAADGRWVAVSTSSDSVAARMMDLLGVGDDERFRTLAGRSAHRAEVNELLAGFIAARTGEEAVRAFDEADCAAALVYDMADIAADEHVAHRQALIEVEGIRMQGVAARLSATPGRVRWVGRDLDADGPAIRAEAAERGRRAGGEGRAERRDRS